MFDKINNRLKTDFTSDASETSAMRSPVAGLRTSNVFPLIASTNSLLIKS